jgi:hypothetical protein
VEIWVGSVSNGRFNEAESLFIEAIEMYKRMLKHNWGTPMLTIHTERDFRHPIKAGCLT